MMNPMTAMLDALSRKYSLGPLVPDEAGVCVLRYDDALDLIIECPPAADSVLVQIPLAPVPGVDREAFFRAALALNHRGEATRGAALSLNETSDTVMLGALVPIAGLDALGLEQLIGNLIDTAQSLSPQLDATAHDGHVPRNGQQVLVTPETQPTLAAAPSFVDPRQRG